MNKITFSFNNFLLMACVFKNIFAWIIVEGENHLSNARTDLIEIALYRLIIFFMCILDYLIGVSMFWCFYC